jgi:hypothetical protein
LPNRWIFPLKVIIVKIKSLEVALPLVAESTMLVVGNLPAQVMNLLLLLLWMIPRGNVFFLFFFFYFLSNFSQSKVLVKVEAGAAEVGVAEKVVVVVVVVVVEKVAVVDVPTTSTVKLAKRTFSPHSLSLLTHPHTSDSDKKVHQGWGGDNGNAEFNTEQAATVDAAVESSANDWNTGPTVDVVDTAADWAGTGAADASADPWSSTTVTAADDWGASGNTAPAPAADNGKPEGRPRRDREPEEEDNTLTLSQYLAQQKEKESAIPKLENTRKANEGASDDLWKDAVPLSKNEEEGAYFVGKVCHFSFFAISPY